MTAAIVEPALRATYHLAGADATRLRRLTRQSGLEAENVLSRLAIVKSISVSRDGPHGDYQPSQAGRTKEIKGAVLLGRPPQAALLLALLARAHDGEFVDPKPAITWHWARGLRLLEDESTGGDVLHHLAVQFAGQGGRRRAPGRAQGSGLGGGVRDELAAAVGRRFPRWSTEVCRLVAMAARLDAGQLDSVAERLASEAETIDGAGLVKESLALRILQEKFGVNRVGLNSSDRATLARLLDGDPVRPDDPSVPFLVALGLATADEATVHLSATGRRLGKEAIHP
jgi:hypothetical protein